MSVVTRKRGKREVGGGKKIEVERSVSGCGYDKEG